MSGKAEFAVESNEEFQLPTRQTLAQWAPELIHRAHSAAQGDVYLLRHGEHELILKDCLRRWGPFRWLWGVSILRREYRMLEHLADAPGVPLAYGWADRYGMLIERFPAVKMPSRRRSKLTPEFFEHLRAIVEGIHARGVAHGDLRRANILVDDVGRPCLIDFATAIRRDSLAGRLFFKRIAHVDLLKVARLKAYYLGRDSLTPEERAQLAQLPLSLRLGRLFKKRIYRPLKQKQWRKRWRKWTKKTQ
jgi:hypothetical protein